MTKAILFWLIALASSLAAQQDNPRSFQNLDLNGDQALTLTEYLGSDAASPREKVRCQQFVVFDFNSDNQLSLGEFAAVPRNTAPQDRTDLPPFYSNVVNRLVAPALAVLQNEVSLADWQTVAAELPWYLPREFQAWDTDQNDIVTTDELERQLHVAFALIRANGSPLRRGTGHVFYAFRFHQFLDRDNSGGLSAKELTLEKNHNQDSAGELVKSGDSNGNGELDPEEVDALDLYWVDVANEFLQRDKNHDGVLTADEIEAFPGWDKQVGALLRAFDLDDSKTWTLSEYSQSPAGNRMLNWAGSLSDTSGDGLLDFQEFWTAVKLNSNAQSMHSVGLAGIVFDQLDGNHNRHLDLDEVAFQVRVENLPTKHAFALLNVDNASELPPEAIIGHSKFIYPFHSVLFNSSDKDRSGRLSQSEFLAGVDWMSIRRTENYVRQHLQPHFHQLDSDQDGLLSYEEWINKNSGQSKIQDFVMQDTDSDQRLTFVEFCGLRGVAPYQHRGPIFDPVTDAVNQVMRESEQVTQTRAALKIINRITIGLKPSNFSDGEYNRHELRHALEILFGIRSAAGVLLRKPTGEVLNLRMFHNLDLDDDGRLSHSEVVTQHWQGPEKGEEIFDSHDSNQDGFLSLDELESGRYCWLDSPSMFRTFDDNDDGVISEKELQAHLPSVNTPDREVLLPAFDSNSDGHLSFVEFRRTPIANPLPRNLAPEDQNHDGKFNFAEFQAMFEDRYHGLTGFFFRHYDLDESGDLNSSEYEFQYHLHRIPPAMAFVLLDSDADGSMKMSEISAMVSNTSTLSSAEHESRMMSVEEAFQQFDQDQDSVLSLQEYEQAGHTIPLRMIGRVAVLPAQGATTVAPGRPPTPSRWRSYVLVGTNVLVFMLVFGLLLRFIKSHSSEASEVET